MYIDNIDLSSYQATNVTAMDEITVFMNEKAQTKIYQKGASSIYIPSTGYESARVTCILAVHLDGSKVIPPLINKEKKIELVSGNYLHFQFFYKLFCINISLLSNYEIILGIYVIETPKAWATQEVIRKWICLMLPRISRGKERDLIVWDSASTHRAKKIKSFLAKTRIDQVMIPAGRTGYLQSLDLVINKPFKDYLRTEINDYIKNRMERNQRGNFVKPSLNEIISWVKTAWDRISDDTVASALKDGYLDERYSFENSSIGKHERSEVPDDVDVIYE